MNINGIFAATVTPYDSDLNIDLDQTAATVKRLEKEGVNGIVCNAHAGEGELLDREEKSRIIRTVKSAISDKVTLVAGVESIATRELVAQAKDAREAGADAVMLCAPPLFAWNASRHPEFGESQIRAVAEETDAPIVLFQYSPNNPFYYAPADIKRMLKEIDRIVAVKLATNLVMSQYEEDLRAVRGAGRPVSALPAVGTMFFYALLAGADGMLSGCANFAARHDVEMIEAVRNGSLAEALEMHKKIYPLFREVYRQPAVDMHIRYKYCTYMAGLIKNPLVRPPLMPLPLADIEALASAMEETGSQVVNKDHARYSREELVPWARK